MSMFGWGVGDIATISALVSKVYTAYKDAPDNYRHISEEVRSLQILISKAARYVESPSLSDNDRQEGQEVLKGCQSILEDLNSLIVKYNSLASANTGQVFKKVKLGGEDIATLRSRLISNTGLLNGFIHSCEMRQMHEMQGRIADAVGLHRTNSRASLDSITSFAGSINTKKAYKKFCKGLFQIGVTPEMISQNEAAIHNIFNPQNTASSSQVVGNSITVEDKPESQIPVVSGAATSPETSSVSTDTNPSIKYKRSRFGWARPPVDFLVGPLMLAAAEEGDATRLLSTLGYIRNINFKDGNQKETALHKAVSRGNIDIVRLLLGKGASIEALNFEDDTPLHLAAWNGHTGVVELLLERGASIGPISDDKHTPLHYAVSNGHIGTVELLLSKGASTEVIDKDSRTPLHLAVSNGHIGTVKLLLGKGASVETLNFEDDTPLHLAAWNGHTGVVELLLERGASIDPINDEKHTPLHLAVSNGHIRIVELLLESGASIDARNDDNKTPLHLAAQCGRTGTVELLLRKGASVEATDINGRTPLNLAVGQCMKRKKEVVEVTVPEFAKGEAEECTEDTRAKCASGGSTHGLQWEAIWNSKMFGG